MESHQLGGEVEERAAMIAVLKRCLSCRRLISQEERYRATVLSRGIKSSHSAKLLNHGSAFRGTWLALFVRARCFGCDESSRRTNSGEPSARFLCFSSKWETNQKTVWISKNLISTLKVTLQDSSLGLFIFLLKLNCIYFIWKWRRRVLWISRFYCRLVNFAPSKLRIAIDVA